MIPNMKTIKNSNQSNKKNKNSKERGLNNLILIQGNSRVDRSKMSQTQTASAVINDSLIQGNYKMAGNSKG